MDEGLTPHQRAEAIVDYRNCLANRRDFHIDRCHLIFLRDLFVFYFIFRGGFLKLHRELDWRRSGLPSIQHGWNFCRKFDCDVWKVGLSALIGRQRGSATDSGPRAWPGQESFNLCTGSLPALLSEAPCGWFCFILHPSGLLFRILISRRLDLLIEVRGARAGLGPLPSWLHWTSPRRDDGAPFSNPFTISSKQREAIPGQGYTAFGPFQTARRLACSRAANPQHKSHRQRSEKNR